jgi:queuine tRNA-ribosyltransferase
MFKVLKTEGAARRGEFSCPHGTVQTPVFMNVGTQAAIKGALSAADLEKIGTQIELSNTYHLHLRPGDEVVRDMGGLHKFMTWNGPILTDSGGFQVFSLAGLRKIKEEGVTFASHLDGHKIFMGPEESMRIQSNLGSDIAMAFDECVENPAKYQYAKASCAGLPAARRRLPDITQSRTPSTPASSSGASIRARRSRICVSGT